MSSQQARQSGVRVTSQQRSAVRQRSIVDATIQVIAEHGVSDVTHRLVAKYANVSVAATTYYYATKLDLIADASGHLLSGNAQNFQRFAERPDPSISFRDLVTRVIINAAETNRLGSLAWCEIVVAGARDPEARALTIDWFDNLTRLWRRIAAMLGEDRPGDLARSAIDLSLGLLFTALAMGSSERNARRVLRGQEDARQVWRPAAPVTQIRPSDMQAFTSKARLTHEKILAAAIDILTSNGKSAVTYRAVAKKAGLTTAAPTYYFPTMDDLLAAAQERLFQNTKKRHDRVMSMIDPATLNSDGLIDLATSVFTHDAVEYGHVSIASYPIWLQAARQASLRPVVWSAITDQIDLWSDLLTPLTGERRPFDALLLQALCAGKLVRILATGVRDSDIAKARSEFAFDIEAILAGRHWIAK